MPRATVSTNTERLELKSLPTGWVDLKRMNYGELLERRSITMKMQMETGGKGKDAKMDIEMANKAVALFEFAHCIVAHNLTDEGDQPLAMTSPDIFRVLDPRVGDEISAKIDEMHDFEAELGKSESPSETTSSLSET